VTDSPDGSVVIIVQDDAVCTEEEEVRMREEDVTVKEEEVPFLVRVPIIEAQQQIHSCSIRQKLFFKV